MGDYRRHLRWDVRNMKRYSLRSGEHLTGGNKLLSTLLQWTTQARPGQLCNPVASSSGLKAGNQGGGSVMTAYQCRLENRRSSRNASCYSTC